MSDVNSGNPESQIRDQTYPIETPSLQMLGSEPVPHELIRDLLRREWLPTSATPTPQIFAKGDKLGVDGRRADVVLVVAGKMDEQYTGHRHEYVDVEQPVTLQITSFESRQRLWNVMAECRRILYKWLLALSPYQSNYWDGFEDKSDGTNNWYGEADIKLTYGAVPAFLRRAFGEYYPAKDPATFAS